MINLIVIKVEFWNVMIKFGKKVINGLIYGIIYNNLVEIVKILVNFNLISKK